LLIALFSNLLLLPSLLLSLDRRITTRDFEEPLIELFEEDDDTEADIREAEFSEVTNAGKAD
jgi:hypothetical protein